MNLDQFLAIKGRTYGRARELQKRMIELAGVAQSTGSTREADKLIAVGERVWLVADRYLETLLDRVGA